MKWVLLYIVLPLVLVAGGFWALDRYNERKDVTPEGPIDAQASVNIALSSKTWTWMMSEYSDGRRTTPNKPGAFTIKFEETGTMTISTDCNEGGGEFFINDGAIMLGDIILTEKACAGSQERLFVTDLRNVSAFRYSPTGDLILDLKSDSGSMIFQ